MTNIEIAKLIKERFNRMLSLNEFKDRMGAELFYNSLKLAFPKILEDIKRDCNLQELTVDYNTKIIKTITKDNKEYIYKFTLVNDEFRIFAKNEKD